MLGPALLRLAAATSRRTTAAVSMVTKVSSLANRWRARTTVLRAAVLGRRCTPATSRWPSVLSCPGVLPGMLCMLYRLHAVRASRAAQQLHATKQLQSRRVPAHEALHKSSHLLHLRLLLAVCTPQSHPGRHRHLAEPDVWRPHSLDLHPSPWLKGNAVTLLGV